MQKYFPAYEKPQNIPFTDEQGSLCPAKIILERNLVPDANIDDKTDFQEDDNVENEDAKKQYGVDELVRNWDTPIRWVLHLANPEIQFFGDRLRVFLENLDTSERWQVQVRGVVGYKFTQHFGTERLANTFLIAESSWIAALYREPYLIPRQLDGVSHYLIETMNGAIEVLTKDVPAISKVEVP